MTGQPTSAPWAGVETTPGARGLNSLYTRPKLEHMLQRERARADRNDFEFSLVLFRARAEDRRLTLRLARLLLRRCRVIDEMGWFDDSCIAVLLPYTSADGARIFAERALKQAQEELIPAICRLYTYPSAWYFSEDRRRGDGGSAQNGDQNHNGKNNNAQNGNSKSNGNGHGLMSDDAKETTRAHPERRSAERRGTPRNNNARNRVDLESASLLPFFAKGFSEGLRPPDAGTDGVELLLVRKMPRWKRAIDIAGAVCGLILLSPIMILSAIAVKGTSRGPVIFRQRRAGLGGQPFWIYKFRTMTTDAEQRKASLRPISEQDGPAFKLTNDPRVTKIGGILRKMSLDELPQFWNVLRGDMSLVGPRPLPIDESAACDRWHCSRLDVTPGLTCIWQVEGRSQVSFDEWMRMDVNYIRGRNFLGDVKILAQTIPAVLLRKGAR